MDQFVKPETAKLAKEKGLKFPEADKVYSAIDDFSYPCVPTEEVREQEFYPAPTQTYLTEVLREQKGLHVNVKPFFVKENEELNIKEHTEYRWSIITAELDSPVSALYKDHNVCWEAGLFKALESL